MNRHLARLSLVVIAAFIVATCLNVHVYAPGLPIGPHHTLLALFVLQLVGLLVAIVLCFAVIVGFMLLVAYLWEKAF